jgi:hypothetical protein
MAERYKPSKLATILVCNFKSVTKPIELGLRQAPNFEGIVGFGATMHQLEIMAAKTVSDPQLLLGT